MIKAKGAFLASLLFAGKGYPRLSVAVGLGAGEEDRSSRPDFGRTLNADTYKALTFGVGVK